MVTIFCQCVNVSFIYQILKKLENYGTKRRIHLPTCVPVFFKVFEFLTLLYLIINNTIKHGIATTPTKMVVVYSLLSYSYWVRAACFPGVLKKRISEKMIFFLPYKPVCGVHPIGYLIYTINVVFMYRRRIHTKYLRKPIALESKIYKNQASMTREKNYYYFAWH